MGNGQFPLISFLENSSLCKSLLRVAQISIVSMEKFSAKHSRTSFKVSESVSATCPDKKVNYLTNTLRTIN